MGFIADGEITSGIVPNSFNKYCEETERQSLTRNGFFKALRTKNFAEVRGRSERYFTGISFKKVTVKSDGNGEFVKVTDEELAELPFA